MVKSKTIFICQTCGYQNYQWMGKCPECSNWNTFTEEVVQSSKSSAQKSKHSVRKPIPLSQLEIKPEMRIKTKITEFDRVLGGGIVPGSVILIGGAPGIGKSTLLLQVCGRFTADGNTILYISGEESLHQIKLRANRIKVESDCFHLATENNIDTVMDIIQSSDSDLVVLDSIQTVYSEDMESVPGNISQVRYCGYRLTTLAKSLNVPIIMVGHVTKEGSLAGPRVLEHLVDCLLLLEGDSQYQYRILRTIKNRFGSTNEVGLFEMTGLGIQEVENPSAHLISQRRDKSSGTVVTVMLEGSRPLMIEVQALVTATSYGMPQRTSTGMDHRRLTMLLAILEKKVGLRFGNQDVFVNAAGGIKLMEPASDLALIVALVSSLKEEPVANDIAVIGEVGLTGEVRGVSQLERRIREAGRLGFKRIIFPKHGADQLSVKNGIKMTAVQSVEDVIKEIF